MAHLPSVPQQGMSQTEHDIHQSQARLKDILRSTLDRSPVEAYFCGFVKQTLVPEPSQSKQSLQTALRTFFFQTTPKNLWPSCMECYIKSLVSEHSQEKRMHMFDALYNLLQDSYMTLCISLEVLKCLDLKKEQCFREGIIFLKKILERADYKSNRTIWKYLLNTIDQFPDQVDESVIPSLQAASELVEFITDRNTAVVPAYPIYHELHYRYFDSEGKKGPHWCIAKTVHKLHQSLLGTANMLTVSGLSYMRYIVGASNPVSKTWNLQHENREYCYVLKGSLPFNKSLTSRQEGLLAHILAQPNSRETLQVMTQLISGRQNQPFLEDLLVDWVLEAMELSERIDWSIPEQRKQAAAVWRQLATNLLYHHFNHIIIFSHILQKLADKLIKTSLHKGRDWLMWCALHYISAAWNTKGNETQFTQILNDFLSLLKVYDFLYPETEALPYPDLTDPYCVVQLAAASVWSLFITKAETMRNFRPIPIALKNHIELLDQLQKSFIDGETNQSDFSIPVLCNACGVYPEGLDAPIIYLINALCGPTGTQTPVPQGCVTLGSTVPMSIDILDTLCMFPKFSFINKIRRQIMPTTDSHANDPSQGCMSPGVIETVSRSLVLPDMEWVSVKAILLQTLSPCIQNSVWPTLSSLLEIISYRVHKHLSTPTNLGILNNLAPLMKTSAVLPTQLKLSVENLFIRLIQASMTPDFFRSVDPKQIVLDSEEMNRLLIRTVAQTINITGIHPETHPLNWLEIFLRVTITTTPMSWSQTAIAYFPAGPLQALHRPQQDQKLIVLQRAEEEYRRWRSIANNENEQLRVYCETEATDMFLCVLWKNYLDTNMIPPIFVRILERTAAQLSARQLRYFSDLLVYEFTGNNQRLTNEQVIYKLNDLIWKYQVVHLDRIVFYMASRKYDGRDGQTCLMLIQLLLMLTQDFKNRLEVLKDKAISFWTQNNWHQSHVSYHQQFPEYFNYEAMQQQPPPSTKPSIPVYYSNVCLRFLPVLDLVVHCFLELGQHAIQSIMALLDHLGSIYRFHDHPIGYVYITLNYYERILIEYPQLRKKLVSVIAGALPEHRPLQRMYTSEFCDYLMAPEDRYWQPSLQYYQKALHRVVEAIYRPMENNLLGSCDWRFEEYHSPLPFVLYSSCVELMALPQKGQLAGKGLIDAFLTRCNSMPDNEKEVWTYSSAVGLLLSLLPETFRSSVNEEIISTAHQTLSVNPDASSDWDLFGDRQSIYVLALLHGLWHHLNAKHLLESVRKMLVDVKRCVKNEAQLVFAFKAFAPFIQRLSLENPSMIPEIVLEFLRLLQFVDQKMSSPLIHTDIYCDVLYHIKYMYVCESSEEVERIINSLSVPLKVRLRFIASPPTLTKQQPTAPHPQWSQATPISLN